MILMIDFRSWGFPGLRPGDRWCLCSRRWRLINSYLYQCSLYLRSILITPSVAEPIFISVLPAWSLCQAIPYHYVSSFTVGLKSLSIDTYHNWPQILRRQAMYAGKAPLVALEASHRNALRVNSVTEMSTPWYHSQKYIKCSAIHEIKLNLKPEKWWILHILRTPSGEKTVLRIRSTQHWK